MGSISDNSQSKQAKSYEPPCANRNDPEKIQALKKLAKEKALRLLNKRSLSLKLFKAQSLTEFNEENKKIQADKSLARLTEDPTIKKSLSLPSLNANTAMPLMHVISTPSSSTMTRKSFKLDHPTCLELIKEEVANEGLETDAGDH